MRFLGVLCLGGIESRLLRQHVGLAAIIAGDHVAHGGHGFAGDLHAIGPHVGDVAIFIQVLRNPHGVAGTEAQPARCFLLQGRCGERRRRVAVHRFGLHRPHGKAILLNGFPRSIGCNIVQIKLRQFLAIQHREARLEGGAIGGNHLGFHAPIFARLVRFDLALAFHHQAQRHRLHAARALGTGQLAPQHRRKREAHQIIQRAPRQIGIDQRLIEIARRLHGLGDSGLGDFIERHPARPTLGQRALVFQPFQQMPADRLPLAIRIGRQDHTVRPLRRLANGGELLGTVRRNLPRHGEILGGVHRAVAGRQIAHMAKAGQHLIVAAEIFVDGLRLGRRFNDNELH